ncbi:MAG: benzoate-CoA ligase family protein [Acidimicrobiia bacterium]|nr:benzoate-CoA ligase family protein [Acidimicrobiia bacterium]
MHEDFNVSQWLLDRHVDEGRGERTAIRSGGQSRSYAEVLERVERFAAGLRSIGVRPEERIALVMLDSPDFVTAFLAAMRIGAIPIPTNPLLPGRDLGVIVADSRARLVVMSEERSSAIDGIRENAPEVARIVTTGSNEWNELASNEGDGSAYQTWNDSPGVWLCTSGTTGRPKLAMHTHGDMRITVQTYARNVLDISENDRCFSVGPMFHAYGLGNSLTFPFAVGATTILEPTRPPTPKLVADIVTSEKASLFFCIPTFYAALTNSDLPDDTFTTIRYGVSAAESLPAETFTKFRERFGVTILDGIGSTELLHIFLSNLPDRHRAGTSGVPVSGYQARVVDADGNECPDGEPGALLVRGASAASGYWCRSEQTRSTFEGQWARTGDLYVKSTDGFYTYLGRADDMMRVGGEWVSPAEVEGILIEHSGVLEAAVVGERDSDGVVRPIAYVIPAADSSAEVSELTEWCRDRLAGYKRPKRYEIVDDLPKTATGKIQRFKLRSVT